MKKPILNTILTAVLSLTMLLAFTACGGSDTESDENGADNTVSTEVVSDYDTVVYTYEDNEVKEDLYKKTVTIEYDGDKVMGVTEVTVDDMSAETDKYIFQMHLEDYDGMLDDTGFKDKDGFTWDVGVNGQVRTEVLKFDMTKFDVDAYKEYVGIENDKDYLSLEDLTKIFEDAGFTKEAEETEEAE
ncbi:MAG: DUF1307 domain-containing protein [Clostridiales bacterium]|nr:DUF1307 domain-containing protein [Clostridiales bacterium]